MPANDNNDWSRFECVIMTAFGPVGVLKEGMFEYLDAGAG